MKTLLSTLVLTAVFSNTLHAADRDTAIESDISSLKGKWTRVKMIRDGKPQNAGELVLALKSYGQFSIRDKDGELSNGYFKIDPAKNVKSIDFLYRNGDGKGGHLIGIYKIDGDTLTTCWPAQPYNRERPLRFTAPSGSNRVLITYERVTNR